MALTSAVTDLQNATAQQQAQDYLRKVQESSQNGGRNVGGDLGKNDFLLLLAAQLRHQDPLEPSSDSEFAAQLAQFTALEQMQNMNVTLEKMNGYQTYSLIGKLVMAEAYIGGEYVQVAGIVESIFVKEGITYAQIGEDVVPVSTITEVFDTSNMLTPEMFMQTASQLVGRTVIAEMNGEDIEGVVTRIYVDMGALYAQLDDGSGEPQFVPVNAIVDIRETGTAALEPKPDFPPGAVNFKPDTVNGGFIEYDDDMVTPVGRWDWNNTEWKWLFTAFAAAPPAEDNNAEGEDIFDDSLGEAA